jgi:hypothetical protein
MSNQNPQDQPSETAGRLKKPYSKPKLEIYGDVAHITRTAAPGGTPDNPTHPNKMHTRP